jgi:hypothetical protein
MTAAGLLLLALLHGQTQETTEDQPAEKKQINLNFSNQYKMLSKDLEVSALEKLFISSESRSAHLRLESPVPWPTPADLGNGFATSMARPGDRLASAVAKKKKRMWRWRR